MLATISVVMDT